MAFGKKKFIVGLDIGSRSIECAVMENGIIKKTKKTDKSNKKQSG